jgi:rod shape-determining protein MreC
VDVGGLSRTAEVRPFVTFATLDLVGVVLANPPTDPADRVLEPRPPQPPEAAAVAPSGVPSAPGTSPSAPPLAPGVTP